MDNKNNGLLTKVWGGPTWDSLHAFTFGYPVEPTEEHKQKYKNFFLAVADVLPCKYCRESYHNFITEGDTALTDNDLVSRETLTKWLYRLHNAVNKKLEVDYYVTYDDVVDKFESIRAKCGADISKKGCVTPLYLKAYSYKKLKHKDCPVILLELIEPFVKIARLRNFEEDKFDFYRLAKKYNGDVYKLKTLPQWEDRNRYCQKIIEHMRENAISSIEQEGTWKGTPSNDELTLLLYMCSNLDKNELYEVTRNLTSNCMYFECCID